MIIYAISAYFLIWIISLLVSIALVITGSKGTSLVMNIGIFFFMIPAFSQAIYSNVLPRTFTWSNPIDVIAVAIGVIKFVASNLPPSPTSIILISVFYILKYFNPSNVKS